MAYLESGSTAVFNVAVPKGGNYWSYYDTSSEGCDDINNDGFCDNPYTFTGGVDNLPWTRQNGWLCSDVPTIEIISFTPELIWPPNHKIKEIKATGRVIIPSGCQLTNAGFKLIDEYGLFSAEANLPVNADGGFELSLPVEAWRSGDDHDGRTYSLTLHAENSAGTGMSNELKTIVPHDLK